MYGSADGSAVEDASARNVRILGERERDRLDCYLCEDNS